MSSINPSIQLFILQKVAQIQFMTQIKTQEDKAKKVYTYQDLIKFSNTEIYSGFGDMKESKKPTSPQFSFGTATRDAEPKKFVSKEMAVVDCFGIQTPKGPNYNVTDKFNYHKGPEWNNLSFYSSNSIFYSNHFSIFITVYMSNKEKCIFCNMIPENVLVLSCNHCICLQCASIQIQRSNNGHEHFIACTRCPQTTELDDDLYEELMQLVTIKFKNNEKRQQNVHHKEPQSQSVHQFDANIHANQLQRTCNSHPEYSIMYVCKVCNDIFICPQCVINGSHKNHEAILIQKQAQKIKAKLQNNLSHIDQKIQQLQKMQKTRVGSIEQRKKQIQRLRNLAKQQYESIKYAIEKEEQIVISKCNQLIASHEKQEQSFSHEIANQIKNYQNQRIELIDLLNPLLEQSIMSQSRSLQKMLMANLVEEYKNLTNSCQNQRNNYIKIAQENMEEDIQIIESLTKKIDRITINNFYQPNRKDFTILQDLSNEKHYLPKVQSMNYPTYQHTYNKQLAPKNKPNSPKNDFFRLL